MPDAPAALSRGSRLQTASASTTAWMAIMPWWVSGMTDGDSSPGSSPLSSSSMAAGAFIIRYFRPRAARTAESIVSIAASSAARSTWATGLATRIAWDGEDIADRAQPVHLERGAGRHEVDDRLGQAEPRRDLDRPGDRDDLDRDAALGEEPTGRVRVGGRDAHAGQGLDRLDRRVRRHGGGEAAAAVAQLADHGQRRAGLGQQVDAGHAEVGHAVADELDDVVGPDEQDVQVEVLDPGDEAAVVLLEDQAGIVQQGQGGLDEAALVRGRPAAGVLSSLGAGRVGVGPGAAALGEPLEHPAVATLAVAEP